MIRLFGRREEFDKRSKAHPITTTHEDPRSYTWSCLVWLDQGQEGACVGYGWSHEAIARPMVSKGIDNRFATGVYNRARQLDQWEGENYEGTSVIAGAKAMMELGHIKGYEWAFSLKQTLIAISYLGPVVLGIPWTEGMSYPDKKGIIKPTGMVQGGHCLIANGYNKKTHWVRLHNSWGKSYGLGGDCFIHENDLEYLLYQGGECCLPIGRLK